MSDMHDTRRFHGGGVERGPEQSKVAAPAPVAKSEPPASVRTQTVFDMGDHRRLWQRVTDLGDEIKRNRTDSTISVIVSTVVVCVGILFVIWRQGANVEERFAAQRKSYEMYQDAMNRQLTFVANENRHAMKKQEQELRLALERLAADAEKDRKTIADLRAKFAEIPKHVDVMVEDPPEQKAEKIADTPAWPPKPSTLAELRQYDGERIISHHIYIDGTCDIQVVHLPYAYGERILVQLFLSRDDFRTVVFRGSEVLNVQALEDAHRNR